MPGVIYGANFELKIYSGFGDKVAFIIAIYLDLKSLEKVGIFNKILKFIRFSFNGINIGSNPAFCLSV